jgi:N-methylhydantoinase B
MRTDPILLEILNNSFVSVAREMGYTLQRTGYTIYVRETADFGTGLVTPGGEFFALSTPIGAWLIWSVNVSDAIRYIDVLHEGDILMFNDVYTSGGVATHLPDINLIKPIFCEGEIIAYGWTFIHCSDVGGSVAGSVSPSSYEIYQEGIRIPPLKLYKQGKLNEELLELFQANVRIPDANWGDVKAQVAAVNTGERRMHELVDKYGLDMVKQAMEDVLEYGQRKAEAVIRDMPEGVYEFSDYVEDDIVSDIPIKICLKMTVSDSEIHLDYTGTDPQVRSAYNVPTMGKRHPFVIDMLQRYLCTRDPGLPINAGISRPISVTLPKGSVLNPEFPAAVGVRGPTFAKVSETILGALATAMPGEIPAASAGTATIVVLSELDLESGKRNILVVEPLFGGTGGRPGKDGVDGCEINLPVCGNNPIENLGLECSLLVREYGVRTDSGGPGKYRGGNGVILEVQATRPGTLITARGMEGYKFRPWGLQGGRHAEGGRNTLNPGTSREKQIGKIDVLELNPGDVLRIELAGGGGYGNPLERDPEKLLNDVQQGFVSVGAAEDEYGVIIEDGEINYEKTKAKRSALAENLVLRDFDFCPNREAYEKIWTPELRSALVDLLYGVPVDIRDWVKKELSSKIEELSQERPAQVEDLKAKWQELMDSMATV